MNVVEMKRIEFKDDEDAVESLKEIGLLSKTKTLTELSKMVYKYIKLNNNITSSDCKIVGVEVMKVAENCSSKVYENLTVEVDDISFDIDVKSIKDMERNLSNKKNRTQEI